jgi:hypothetical protein
MHFLGIGRYPAIAKLRHGAKTSNYRFICNIGFATAYATQKAAFPAIFCDARAALQRFQSACLASGMNLSLSARD